MSEDRSEIVSIKVTAQEKEALRHLAFERRTTISSYIRDMLIKHIGLDERASFFGDDAQHITHDSSTNHAAETV